ncbi:hypothetical protein Y032_0011g1478 [Ancylostoma ceylanicum]|nr:hypothetical protein Y032_0011g1478 [Ancylostoma ceylanicum]
MIYDIDRRCEAAPRSKHQRILKFSYQRTMKKFYNETPARTSQTTLVMDAPFVNVELSITNRECCERSAKELLKIIRPRWQQSAVLFEVYTAGITNKIMSAFVDPSEKLVFRIFGKNTENFIDRSCFGTHWGLNIYHLDWIFSRLPSALQEKSFRPC